MVTSHISFQEDTHTSSECVLISRHSLLPCILTSRPYSYAEKKAWFLWDQLKQAYCYRTGCTQKTTQKSLKQAHKSITCILLDCTAGVSLNSTALENIFQDLYWDNFCRGFVLTDVHFTHPPAIWATAAKLAAWLACSCGRSARHVGRNEHGYIQTEWQTPTDRCTTLERQNTLIYVAELRKTLPLTDRRALELWNAWSGRLDYIVQVIWARIFSLERY